MLFALTRIPASHAMPKNDIIGLGTSIGLHVLLLILFGFLSMGSMEPEPIGYIEVEFGPLAEGRSVQQSEVDEPEAPEEPVEPEPEQQEPEAAPPEEAKPVELPDQPEEIVDEEQVETPESETISPTEQSEPTEVQDPEPQPEPSPQPLGGGAEDGADEGETEGDAGPGQQEERTAPFQIEGLNRTPTSDPLPTYNGQNETLVKMRITVNPRGEIVAVFPVIKGSAAFETAVRDILRNRWRFNALPSNAPQENQTGLITFRYIPE